MTTANNVNSEEYYVNLVDALRQKKNVQIMCKEEKNILRKCILCRSYLSSNQWAPIMEEHIMEIFGIRKKKNNTSGDGNTNKNFNIEIKVSLGTDNGQVNFVQIRPDHDVDYYILLVYNLHEEQLGKVHWFLCKSQELYHLIPEYGGYAHGTTEKLGKITLDNIHGRNCEYCLRPNPKAKETTKPKLLWNRMVELFEVSEEDIINTIS